MVLSPKQQEEIKNLLIEAIEEKLTNYARETNSMPFLARLLQDSEKVAAYSFIHSLATSLGMSMYEQIAKIIAKPHYNQVETGYDVTGDISNEENAVISRIIQEIKNKKRTANKEQEIKEILACKAKTGKELTIRADLFLKKGDTEYYIEIKTAKPNIDVFSKSKEKLLQWIALRKQRVITLLAIPYNPYHPEPYNRFTMQGYLDEANELYVAEKFWELLGGEGTYEEVLRIFDEAGKALKKEIQEKIKQVAKEKMSL